MKMRLTLVLCAGLAVLIAGSAWAAITTYSGLDAGAGPADPRPNATAAAASFDAAASALGPLVTENFESAPLGNFATLPLANTTITLAGTDSAAAAGITTDTSFASPVILGYNTTSGGAKFLRFVPLFAVATSSAEFTFPRPVQAWGAMLTGVETFATAVVTIVFNDGTAQSFSAPGSGSPAGGASFFGFTDPGKAITSIKIQEVMTSDEIRDILGIDDVRFVFAPPATKDDCKNGGWEIYGIFKNQGDCVSFVATGGKNPPADG